MRKNIIKELKNDGLLLKKILKKEQTAELCKIAIEQNPLALQYASIRRLDFELCFAAVKENPQAFRHVPEKFITKELCELAVDAVPQLLKNVPENFRTPGICINAVKKDVSTLTYVPQDIRHKLFNDDTELTLIECIIAHDSSWLAYMPNRSDIRMLCIKYMEQDFSIAKYMPEQIKMSLDILDYQKSKGTLQSFDKYYDSSEERFKVRLEVLHECQSIYSVTVEFEDFDRFYDFLDGNLFDAELGNYGFEGIDLTRYNIKGAVINSEILQSQGLYDGSYFMAVKKLLEDSPDDAITNNEIMLNDFCYLKPVGDVMIDRDCISFFYVSDIHLTHRVCNRFRDMATKEEIHSYIKEIARNMVSSAGAVSYNCYLLIAGDTSSIFEFSVIFYNELINLWTPSHIIVVPGNHELWDPQMCMDENIEVHRKFFDDLGIRFLQNDLICIKKYYSLTLFEYTEKKWPDSIISEDDILELDEEELRERSRYSSVIILGGLGFSGLNQEFNASNIRYGKSFDKLPRDVALQKDIQEAGRFNTVYEKVLKSLGRSKVIVLTHTQKEDWNAGAYNPYWIYVSGHTHRNFSHVDDCMAVYADNQIGYKSQNVCLKYFYCDNAYDTFAYYQDGIHEITREQYIDFNRGKSVCLTFKRDYGTIYMLKRKSLYMFLIYCEWSRHSSNKRLWLMNGGKLVRLKRDCLEDLSYYYNHIEKYAENVKKLLHKYSGGQQKLSEFVKRLGGSGSIHGCIVDVEKPDSLGGFSYCHLFVNPIDGKVTPYFAWDVKSRYVYRDFKTLLQKNRCCELMAKNYLRLEKESPQDLPSVQYFEPAGRWEHATDMYALNEDNDDYPYANENYMYDEGCYIYKVSRIIKSLQYCVEKNIIRLWNEELLNHDFIFQIETASQIDDIIDDRLMVDEAIIE